MTADAGRFREETMDARREEDWDLWLSRSLARLDEQYPDPPWSDATAGNNQKEISEETGS